MKHSDWKEKTLKTYGLKDLLRDHLSGVDVFPLHVNLKKITGRELTNNFSLYRKSIEEMVMDCQNQEVEVVFGSLQHRTLGPQSLPQELVFKSRQVYLRFIGRQFEFDIFQESSAAILSVLPELRKFFVRYPLKLLLYTGDWLRIARVCEFLLKHPNSGLYLRQIEIPQVDTKFIETHKKILTELIHTLSSGDEDQSLTPSSLSVDSFEERHGLKKEPPRLRLRALDSEISSFLQGLDDVEVPLAS